MKYFVIEDDELFPGGEEEIYVFQHTKKKRSSEQINSLEDFAACCSFIDAKNSHWFWHKGKDITDMGPFEFQRKLLSEQPLLTNLPKEEYIKIKDEFSTTIQPFVFPDNPIRSAYAFEPEWNNRFFVMETEELYFGLYWTTSA